MTITENFDNLLEKENYFNSVLESSWKFILKLWKVLGKFKKTLVGEFGGNSVEIFQGIFNVPMDSQMKE